MAGMAGMVERQKEWQNDKMAEVVTYVLFMVHANTMAERHVEWWNGRLAGMVEWQEWREWREWRNGRKNGRMAEWQKWIHTYYLWYTPTPTPTSTLTPTPTPTPTTLKSFISRMPQVWCTRGWTTLFHH
jgi:hypothetical protein